MTYPSIPKEAYAKRLISDVPKIYELSVIAMSWAYHTQ